MERRPRTIAIDEAFGAAGHAIDVLAGGRIDAGGTQRRRWRPDARDIQGKQPDRREPCRYGRDSQHAGEELEREGDDRHVQPRHAQHVYQPRAREAIPLVGADGRHVGDHERPRHRRVGAEQPVDSPADTRAKRRE